MGRKVFYSFHYKPDNWRVSQVRNIGALEDNKPASDNDWETITSKGDTAIQRWIDDQMGGRSCTVVLIGSETASRKWVKYEIKKAWDEKKGVVGIYIHNLKNNEQKQAAKGGNPFETFKVGDKKLSSIVKSYDPPYSASDSVYSHIKNNMEIWVGEAISIRNNY